MNVLTNAEPPSSIENNGFLFDSVPDKQNEGKWRMAEHAIRRAVTNILTFRFPTREAEPMTYHDMQLFVSKKQRCECRGTCPHCRHIIEDVWRS